MARTKMSSFKCLKKAGCHLKGKSEFLKVSPKFLGALEISIGLVGIFISLWSSLFYLVLCFSVLTGAVTILAEHKSIMFLIRSSQMLNFFCVTLNSISVFIHTAEREPLWAAMTLVACNVLICVLSAIVASTADCGCCDCCRSSETTYPEQREAHQQDNRPGVIVQNTVIAPDSDTLPTVNSSVRCVLPSEHSPDRLSYFEELEETGT